MVKDHFFVYWQFPDGVRIMLDKDSATFLYPSGLEPGVHNFVSEHIRLLDDYSYPGNRDEIGGIFFEYINAPKQADPYSKPYPRDDCRYRGKSMFANVRVVDESEAFAFRSKPTFYVRVVEPDSDEKADFDVYPVVNHRWGTECAQWRWVDSGEDFCVIFGFGGDFTIRIMDNK